MKFYTGSNIGTKRELLERLLDKGMVMVHLDARRDSVDVPSRFLDNAHLRLNLSYRFGLDHFEINDTQVSASLSFQGRRYLCVLPFDAIFAITSHIEPIGYIWPESIPPELAAHFQHIAQPAPPPAAKPRFEVIEGEGLADEEPNDTASADDTEVAETEPTPATPTEDTPQGARRYGHLRVVK